MITPNSQTNRLNITRISTISGLFVLLLNACSLTTKPSHTDHVAPKKFETTQQIIFSDTGWQERIFAGSTIYEVVHSNNKSNEILKASANGTASMLYKVADIDLTQTPFIQWDWKVNNTYTHKNERSRKGDDFPARIYIAIASKTGSIFPRALTYVWSSNSTPLSSWKNPYTNAVAMLSLQNGETNSQQWVSEKRNLKDDLAQQFGEDIENIKGIAVMTDADNTGANAVSFYRNLRFTQQ